MFNYILIGLLGSILATVSQLILKVGAKKRANSNRLRFFINPYTVVGYFLMLVVTLLNLYVFKFLDLKYALIFLPTTFILVLLFSTLILKERLINKNITGAFLIILGIIVFNL
jgi:uncharacterized membrane protein